MAIIKTHVEEGHQGSQITISCCLQVEISVELKVVFGAGMQVELIVIIATGPHMSWMNWTCQNQTYMATNDPNLSKIIIVLDFVIVINGTEMNPTSPRYQKISSKDGNYTELANKLQFLLSFISVT